MIHRLSRLLNLILERRLDAILVSSIPNITYLTNFSTFSKDEREAFLLITKDRQYILTDGRYIEAVRSKIKNFTLVETSSRLTFERILKDLTKKHKIKKVGIEYHNITIAEHKKLSPFSQLKHFNIETLRAIKTASEISAIEKACKLSDKTFEHVLTCINKGISEKQLAFEVEFFIKKQGADISFPPIIAFGKNSAYPHHKSSNQKLKTKDIILIDFGAKVNNYCSDMTRTIFFEKPTNEQKKMCQTVIVAQQKAIELLHLGGGRMDSSEVDRIARDYIMSQGYPRIPHGVGHGIGLEVHESPRLSPKSKDKLKEGMVFTIEPGIYIPNFGGVRIEDVVVLEKSGPRLLTHSPKEFIELVV